MRAICSPETLLFSLSKEPSFLPLHGHNLKRSSACSSRNRGMESQWRRVRVSKHSTAMVASCLPSCFWQMCISISLSKFGSQHEDSAVPGISAVTRVWERWPWETDLCLLIPRSTGSGLPKFVFPLLNMEYCPVTLLASIIQSFQVFLCCCCPVDYRLLSIQLGNLS